MSRYTCGNCGNRLIGRTDKRFCTDKCRNSFHNRRRGAKSQMVRRVNYILHKNRDIIKVMRKDISKVVPKKTLEESGFDFSYHTHINQVAEGPVQYFCYDYGYYDLNNECLALIKRKESS